MLISNASSSRTCPPKVQKVAGRMFAKNPPGQVVDTHYDATVWCLRLATIRDRPILLPNGTPRFPQRLLNARSSMPGRVPLVRRAEQEGQLGRNWRRNAVEVASPGTW